MIALNPNDLQESIEKITICVPYRNLDQLDHQRTQTLEILFLKLIFFKKLNY